MVLRGEEKGGLEGGQGNIFETVNGVKEGEWWRDRDKVAISFREILL